MFFLWSLNQAYFGLLQKTDLSNCLFWSLTFLVKRDCKFLFFNIEAYYLQPCQTSMVEPFCKDS